MFRRDFLSLLPFGLPAFLIKEKPKEEFVYFKHGETTFCTKDGIVLWLYDGKAKRWFNAEGQLHRVDAPAIELDHGRKAWYQNGQLHRVGGPAVEYPDGTKEWCLNDQFHRTDGPAFECADGHKEWWLHGKHHRVDGPAIEYADGHKGWYLNGQFQNFRLRKFLKTPSL